MRTITIENISGGKALDTAPAEGDFVRVVEKDAGGKVLTVIEREYHAPVEAPAAAEPAPTVRADLTAEEVGILRTAAQILQRLGAL